jgi:hypothetical protein
MLVVALVWSMVVSLVSAFYYFKVMELLAPTMSGMRLDTTSSGKAFIVHDYGSVFVTIFLVVTLASWSSVVCITQYDIVSLFQP